MKILLTISFADQNKNEPSPDGFEPPTFQLTAARTLSDYATEASTKVCYTIFIKFQLHYCILLEKLDKRKTVKVVC